MSFTVSFAKDKEVELTVQGQGNTKEEAVVNALQNALAQVNGTFMSSNSTITMMIWLHLMLQFLLEK